MCISNVSDILQLVEQELLTLLEHHHRFRCVVCVAYSSVFSVMFVVHCLAWFGFLSLFHSSIVCPSICDWLLNCVQFWNVFCNSLWLYFETCLVLVFWELSIFLFVFIGFGEFWNLCVPLIFYGNLKTSCVPLVFYGI